MCRRCNVDTGRRLLNCSKTSASVVASVYASVFLRMSRSFTPDAAPLSFKSSWMSFGETVFAMRACVRARWSNTRVRRTNDRRGNRREAIGGDADVGEIPFGKSLERRRSHKWTRQPTPARLPLSPRILLIAYARIHNVSYALAYCIQAVS